MKTETTIVINKDKEKVENDNLAQVQGYKDFESAPKGSK